MQKKTVLLAISAFVFGCATFWLVDTIVKSKTTTNTATHTTETPSTPNQNSLNLKGQGLDKLPLYVLARTNLEELDISNNKLTGALPSEIGKLTKLKVLRASNNLMTGVPAEIGHLSNLEILDLSNNQLTGLPNELAQLKKLKMLNLRGNNYSKQDLDVIRKGLSPNVTIVLD